MTSPATPSATSLVVNGLVSGINTTQVIQALLTSYQQPITDLQNEQSDLSAKMGDYRTINSDMQAVLSAANALNTPGAWNLMTATTTNQNVATATADAGAQAGSLSFNVTSLAQANVLLSAGSVSSVSASVASGTSLLASTGGAALGFSSLAAGNSLGLGSHTISVTQASSSASLTGSSLPSSTTITTGSNDTVDLSVNGTAYALTLAAGSYSPSQLVQALNSAASSAGAPIDASLTNTGAVQLSSNLQGSTASLSLTGGSALASLGLTVGAQSSGTDAVVSVDGTTTTLSSLQAGATVTLNAPQGSITATIASTPTDSGALIGLGSAAAALVSTGDGSLNSVISALNGSGLSMHASAVAQSSGGYRLQVAAGNTGLAGAVELDPAALSSGPLASMQTITAATDAAVNVGGASGYTLTSSTNTFTNLMAGTNVTVLATGSSAVTVSPDATGEAKAVSSLVSAANQALSDINSLAGYNASTKTGGPLMGSATLESLRQAILSSFAGAAGTSGLGSSAAVGITLSSTGTINFDQSKFESAFASDPTKVASLFTQDGTFSPASPGYSGQVSLVYAGTGTTAGSFPVSITASAAPASDTGATLASGTVSAAETLTVAMNGNSATYTVNAGESLQSIAAGLNGAFSGQGLLLSALVQNNALEIQSNETGSAQSFTVSTTSTASGTTGLGGASANTPVSFSGSDVAGSINGVVATGSGSLLVAPASDPTLAGLSLLVTTPNITSATALGSFTYVPGLAQQLASIATTASDATTGSLTDAIKSLQAESDGLNPRIASDQAMLSSQQSLLQNQFATMEATLGSLKNESTALQSAIAGLP